MARLLVLLLACFQVTKQAVIDSNDGYQTNDVNEFAVLPSSGHLGHVMTDNLGHRPVFYGFTAMVSARHLDRLNIYEPIKFDYVITNEGKVYDRHTGVFKAPVAGVYAFSVGGYACDGSHTFLELMHTHQAGVNCNEPVTRIHPDARKSKTDSASRTVFLKLALHSEVLVRLGEGGDRTVHGGRMTSFSGWRVH